MINWKEVSDLHVISKLEEILGKWFGVEVFYTDNHYKIRSHHTDKDYKSKNHFMNVQMHMNYGHEYIGQDIEKITDQLVNSKEDTVTFSTFFPHVQGIASKIVIDGEMLGTVISYPFVHDSITQDEQTEITAKLIECGADKNDAKSAVEHLRKMNSYEMDYLEELNDLVACEIETFHEEISKREERIQDLNSELGNKYRYHTMIGKSKKMQHIYNLLDKISNSESSVFIQGSNGTGKELIAKAVHFYSPRKDNMFLALNCSAFNDNLLDSELFGHIKGAFTGAVKDKKGLFEMADGGTLFLDEIGDTSLSMQVKLLRVLQEGTYLPVGATSQKKADVRIIAATNKNIKEMMVRGEFREDLFYRINVINVKIPALREREGDIHLLMDHFLQKRCAESGIAVKTVSRKVTEMMLNYPWPGNVRELENEIERLVVLSGDSKSILPEHVSPRIVDFGQSSVVANRGINTSGNLKKALEELEIIMIREGLRRCDFNKSKLAKELGISRASLIMKVEKYGLDKRKKAVGE
ncbi:MAG: sigma 54-interacting transcriptional regulator [Bacteriovoracaceae bacterium]|nr:sigma 54-interacting transcriptional regulator [Bacteriovoracaceae bacterium]